MTFNHTQKFTGSPLRVCDLNIQDADSGHLYLLWPSTSRIQKWQLLQGLFQEHLFKLQRNYIYTSFTFIPTSEFYLIKKTWQCSFGQNPQLLLPNSRPVVLLWQDEMLFDNLHLQRYHVRYHRKRWDLHIKYDTNLERILWKVLLDRLFYKTYIC